MPGHAGRFFQLLGRFQDDVAEGGKPIGSGFTAVRTVRTVFPISSREVEKKREKEKGKVEIRKYRPNRLIVLRPATVFAPAETAR